MPSLLATIEKDFLTAYKAKQEVDVSVLRALKTAATMHQKDKGELPNDDQMLDIVSRQIKQRKESIDQFTKAGRTELADREIVEMDVLARYMPEPLSSEEVSALVDATIAETGATDMKDMGKVMGAITSAYKGRVDGKELSTLVRSKLS